MAEPYLTLTSEERVEALGVAATASGRPVYLLAKDIWVVWALQGLFESKLGEHLVFKGGTSLSKGYNIVQRFSEDVDHLRCSSDHPRTRERKSTSRCRQDAVSPVFRAVDEFARGHSLPSACRRARARPCGRVIPLRIPPPLPLLPWSRRRAGLQRSAALQPKPQEENDP
jgi:hypothetical protein